jgi:anti-sigma-K factor RskA
MIFRGLEPNDPRSAQFQLWIFDPSRVDWDKTPVDGGVFDVSAGEQVVIPIHAKLPVQDVALFAVTLEKPGGVVVSKREHLLLTAPVS